MTTMMLIHTCACIQMSSNRNKKKAKKQNKLKSQNSPVVPKFRQQLFFHATANLHFYTQQRIRVGGPRTARWRPSPLA